MSMLVREPPAETILAILRVIRDDLVMRKLQMEDGHQPKIGLRKIYDLGNLHKISVSHEIMMYMIQEELIIQKVDSYNWKHGQGSRYQYILSDRALQMIKSAS